MYTCDQNETIWLVRGHELLRSMETQVIPIKNQIYISRYVSDRVVRLPPTLQFFETG